MGVLRTMMNYMSRRRARAAEQAEVDQALAAQREAMRREMHAFMDETRCLRSTESRMLDAFAGMGEMVSRANRKRQEQRQ